MGDRTNPIKFGPEWLRNLARERSIRSSPGAQTGATGVAAAPPGMGGSPVAQRSANPPANSPKVLLARLRYGREEMLALYDRQTAEAPAQLKNNDTLYIPRGLPPYALNNTFEEDARDSINRQPPVGGQLTPSDRYPGVGRGRGLGLGDTKSRGIPLGDSRGKSRGYNRPVTTGRGWHLNRGVYSGMPDDDPNQTVRPWGASSHQTTPVLRPNNGEQPEWQTKQQQYRIKRQTSTNWRQQQGREEGEEWRSSDGARRPQDKWPEWGWQQEPSNRPNQEKQWHTNRRSWMGGEGGEDALPEWAVDNAEACGGTFDSSGAFHGYSNDDSNIPKNPETSYPLVKSHTHGSFARTKMAEEGYEEWWASEKAKKLSPKRFNQRDIPFKKSTSVSNADEKSNVNPAVTKTATPNGPCTKSTGAIPKRTYQSKSLSDPSTDKPAKDKSAQPSKSNEGYDDNPESMPPKAATTETDEYKDKNEDITKEKAFESRPISEKHNEQGNFKSVILTSNNTLRQKHQNIVVTPTETPKRQPKLMQYMETTSQPRQTPSDASDFKNRKETDNNKIVEDILQMTLDDGIPSATINQLLTSHSNSSMDSSTQVPYPSMQMRMASTLQGLNTSTKQTAPLSTGIQTSEGYNGMMQKTIGITNSMLNASLGLPLPNSSTGLPQAMPPSLSNSGLPNPNVLSSGIGGGNLQQPGLQQGAMQTPNLQSGQVSGLQGLQMQGYGMQSGSALQNQLGNMPNTGLQAGGAALQSVTSPMSGVANSSLFNNQLQHSNDMNNYTNTLGNPVAAYHRLQQLASQRYNNGMYGNMLSMPPPIPPIGMQQLISDQWYYEDPNKTVQGPFSSIEMLNWYRAGFFNSSLMVRRERDPTMRPLGTYGPVPFGTMDVIPQFPIGGGYDLRPQQSHDMLNPQQGGLGIDGLTPKGHPSHQHPHIESNIQYNLRNNKQAQKVRATLRSAGPVRPRPVLQTSASQPQFQLVQNNEVQSLWGQPANNAANSDHMWMQGMNNNSRSENPINNLPMFFWDNQPAEMPTTPMLPETIKTEEEILAQMRSAQAQGPTSPLSFFAESPVIAQEAEPNATNAAPNVNQLQKVIQKDIVAPIAAENIGQQQQVLDKPIVPEAISTEPLPGKGNKADKNADVKPPKEVAKVDNGKPKGKEATKPKSKKGKEEKKEETVEVKAKEEEIVVEKRSAEPSPSPKIKKDDKSIKKDLEKEKKEWIKEGFTIVKGTDKSKDKDTKKKAEEAKAAEDSERKKKEEEKLVAEEKKRQLDAFKKQPETTSQQASPVRQAIELISRKAPWSASSQGHTVGTREGPTLAEIQRLEREKKLEQMKEQQQMMQIIAQQQAVALAREQEMQTGLGWAKKPTSATTQQTLSEIQAETRKQAAVEKPREEVQSTPPPVTVMPWASVQNGGAGFWDSPHPEPVKTVPKPAEIKAEMKHKKKVSVMASPKQENTPSVEFDMWCTNMLVSWRETGIDVPTFVSFLRDIESPYEVKDYVKCYLGDSREAGDFAKQFLEKRSRLMRVGMVTPSDDLCSPAVAVNPRTISGSDHAELKTKGKKTKKNKMLKVDARNILGFSVTASEDRINVGDIDTV